MDSRPQVFLSLEALPGEATLARLEAALTASPVASVLLTAPANGGVIDPKVAAPLVRLIQARNAAALIAGSPQLAVTLVADGVHVSARDHVEEAYVAAREHVGRDRIVGVEIAQSRHDAMSLGEMGADYLAFSGPGRDELVAWWAEVFVVPCVALGVASAEEAELLASAGADFIGIALPPGGTIGGAEAHVRLMAGCLSSTHQLASHS